MDKQDGKIWNLPVNINNVIPTSKPDAKQITKLIKHGGHIEGYELSNGQKITKEEGVSLAKTGEISGVAVAMRNGNEYLRSLPDDKEGNNLSNLPSVSE